MDSRAPSMLKACLIGGAASGVASAIPIVGMLNACCCALIIGGGFLAAFVYRGDCMNAGVAFRPGTGALVGLVAGAFYAIVYTPLYALVFSLSGGIEMILQQMQASPGMDPEVFEGIEGFFERTSGAMLIALAFFVSVILGAIFSTVGGLIGGAVFKFEPAPPAAPAGGTTPPPAQP